MSASVAFRCPFATLSKKQVTPQARKRVPGWTRKGWCIVWWRGAVALVCGRTQEEQGTLQGVKNAAGKSRAGLLSECRIVPSLSAQ